MQKHLLAVLFVVFSGHISYSQNGLDCFDAIQLCEPGQTEPSIITGQGTMVTGGTNIANGSPADQNAEFSLLN